MQATSALRRRIPLRDAIAETILRVGDADPTPELRALVAALETPPTGSSPATAAARPGPSAAARPMASPAVSHTLDRRPEPLGARRGASLRPPPPVARSASRR